MKISEKKNYIYNFFQLKKIKKLRLFFREGSKSSVQIIYIQRDRESTDFQEMSFEDLKAAARVIEGIEEGRYYCLLVLVWISCRAASFWGENTEWEMSRKNRTFLAGVFCQTS